MTSVYMRVRETIEHYVVAICDEDLLGKTLTQGSIKFTVSEEFYGGDLVDVSTCMTHINRATIVNMIGKVTVQAAIDAGIVHKNAVIYIDGHPHAQWVRL
ncbi:MAG: DUF424 family protein [Candidatus Thorarchaeota archaeon]|nr:DUF424 family protein [Candidatus Thorarchaeota archaeon]